MKSEELKAIFDASNDALSSAIGSLFINFALFNSRLNGALSVLMHLSLEQARALVLPMMPRAKLELVHTYTKTHWDADDFKHVKEICKRALELTDYRNSIAHGDMVKEDQGSPVTLITYKGAGRFSPKSEMLSPETVSQAAMHALYLAKEFRALSVAIAQDKKYTLDDLLPETGQ